MTDKRPLHIAIFIDDFYPASGGIGRSIQTQIGELVRLGHKVTLFAPEHQLHKPDNCETYVTPSLYFPGSPSHTCSLRYGTRLARRISKTHTFDAVHSQTERGGLVLAARIAKIQNIPHIHTFHANISGTHAALPILSLFSSAAYATVIAPTLARVTPARHPGKITMPPSASKGSWVGRVDWKSLAKIAARVDHFVTPSSFMMEAITSCMPGAYKKHGHIIPTGVNPAFSRHLATLPKKADKDHPIRFLSVGRLAKEKRVDAMVAAFIEAGIPGSELHVVGSGERLAALQKLASTNTNIYFHSHINNLEEIASHYYTADVFVLASYGFDNQPITLIEAAAAGLPIVYCDPRLTVGVTKENSILTASPDIDAIAEAFIKIADPKLRKKLTAASTKASKSLSADVMAERYVALYRS